MSDMDETPAPTPMRFGIIEPASKRRPNPGNPTIARPGTGRAIHDQAETARMFAYRIADAVFSLAADQAPFIERTVNLDPTHLTAGTITATATRDGAQTTVTTAQVATWINEHTPDTATVDSITAFAALLTSFAEIAVGLARATHPNATDLTVDWDSRNLTKRALCIEVMLPGQPHPWYLDYRFEQLYAYLHARPAA